MSEGDLNFKKLHQAVNFREDWSGFLLYKFPSFFFYVCVCVLETCVSELCMIQKNAVG